VPYGILPSLRRWHSASKRSHGSWRVQISDTDDAVIDMRKVCGANAQQTASEFAKVAEQQGNGELAKKWFKIAEGCKGLAERQEFGSGGQT